MEYPRPSRIHPLFVASHTLTARIFYRSAGIAPYALSLSFGGDMSSRSWSRRNAKSTTNLAWD